MQDRKVMLFSLAFDRFWAGVSDTSCNTPQPCSNASQTVSTWYFPLAGSNEAGGDSQSSAKKENWLGLQDS